MNKIIYLISPKILNTFISIRRLFNSFNGGVFLDSHKKISSLNSILPAIIPNEIILPLQQHVGIQAEPIVKVGDKVLKNQLVANVQENFGVPIHATTSGTISKIENRTLSQSSYAQSLCLIIQPDGKDKQLNNVLNTPEQLPQNPVALKKIILQAGIIGMGGAGFPTYAKIPDTKNHIHTLIINGAECEPYINCDDALMQTKAEQIIKGALITADALGVKKILCGIESNKQQAIKRMSKASCDKNITIIPVPTIYPMGGQNQLILQLTNIEIHSDNHSVDTGILMLNVATSFAIYDAVINGNPLTSRIVTINGDGVENKLNINTKIGTPISALLNIAKTKDTSPDIIIGGPMMGYEINSTNIPVMKTTNCILVKNTVQKEQLPCIRCGKCMEACPVNLLPQQLYWFSHAEQWDKLVQHKLFDCIECGCCDYVCPSNIPLVQYYRYAKSEIQKNTKKEKLAIKAKQRFEQRLARIEKEKQLREKRLKEKKLAIKQQKDKKLDSISLNKNQANTLSARDKAILAAKKRIAQQKEKTMSDNKTPTTAQKIKE